jgi:hypothetical protein
LGGQKFDSIDGKPFSTEFSFSRFLVPTLNQYKGRALFMDSDMFVRSDILELWDTCVEGDYPIWCVHHDYAPHDPEKMDGVIQTQYGMKNWSSFMMFDCGHAGNANLSPWDVSNQTGNWLHTMKWLRREYGSTFAFRIGKLNEEWNWLDGHSTFEIEPKNVHFTTGGPWFDGWLPHRQRDEVFSSKWLARADALEKQNENL